MTTTPFDDDQLALLQAELDPHLAARMSPDGRGKVSYIEAFVVIEQANRIFGYGNWGYELVREERDVDPESGAGVYSAWVRVTVKGCEPVTELGDCVLSVGQGRKANAAQKSMARKGAVTDGMKRGLRHFGDQFGNSLYDKDSEIHKMIDLAEREDQQQQRTAASFKQATEKAIAQASEKSDASRTRDALEADIKKATTSAALKKIGAEIASLKQQGLLDDADRDYLAAEYDVKARSLAKGA